MVNGNIDSIQQGQADSNATGQTIMSSLPPEIAHITANYYPLPFILQRLAQKSHNELQLRVEELARMPPGQGAAANGNPSGSGEDSSEENQNKKAFLLNFLNELHAKWTKALVMSEWSRKSGQVSKLVDLHSHILEQLAKYNIVLDRMGHVKRGIYDIRLPNPDIKTALQVLSTGRADWMPGNRFIPPPALKAEEIQKWFGELNTLLSFRLTLHDYDKIPYEFRDFTVKDGRVTFKVQGEFEVDLTIGNDDPESQWWFIDFRFDFSPAPQELTDKVRHFMTMNVNDVLGRQGLKGCYDFLHGYVLTHKIRELQRQAVLLSQQHWINHIKVEPLNRALCIQYWAQRYLGTGPKPEANAGPKSWIIIGVNSGKTPSADSLPSLHPTSYLTIRWFRDGKEVTGDADLSSFGTETISAEDLLNRIICKHVSYILKSISDKLMSKPRYASRQVSVSMKLHKSEPSESILVIQLTHSETLSVKINGVTGNFYLEPTKPLISRREAILNLRGRDAVEDSFGQIEHIRCESLFEELVRLGRAMGWVMCKRPVLPDEAKKLHPSREFYQLLWLRRDTWPSPWYVVVCVSLAGDNWWLVEVVDDGANPAKAAPSTAPNRVASQLPDGRNNKMHNQPNARIKTYKPLTMPVNPKLSTDFFSRLTKMVNVAMCGFKDSPPDYHGVGKPEFGFKPVDNPYLPPGRKMPGMFYKTAAVMRQLPSRDGERTTRPLKTSWAGDYVTMTYREEVEGAQGRPEIIQDVKVKVKDKSMFSLIKKKHVDRDVRYDAQAGQFVMQIQRTMDSSCIPLIATRLKAIDRLVEFVSSMGDRAGGVKCESVTLRKFVFTYGEAGSDASTRDKRWKVTLDLAKHQEIKIHLEAGSPHTRILDMLNKLINSQIGMKALPRCLQATLPLHRVLDSLEATWAVLSENGQGFFEVVPHALDWITVHFELAAVANNKSPRRLRLSVRVRTRNGEAWWEVQRYGREGGQRDELDEVLQPIFTSRITPEGWQGLDTAVVVKVGGGGIEALLSKISAAVKALATGVPATAAAIQLNMASSQAAPIVLD
ncbi:MED14-domain-containing protein [Cryphonectria parasitica EP155]|uniref:Mediator of RNA polymerase II transcription subunit 14 n=1 Tax=Cryphonectria parasitica (strain ATCC 38755 / EP155) TaxID=660469 RepID=A0A9P5CLT0_CRYP1|nr:MED14-domain-containing protein [Cryphonectria parasitica EP155]KAF3762351.1 MED14-domain-containing protein [Cryphonectria parasitica EP155]